MEVGIASIKLTVDEYASIRGCSARYVRNLCISKKIEAIEKRGNTGKGGKSYLIPISSLTDKEVKRYLKKNNLTDLIERETREKIIDISYEKLSDEQRKELNKKIKILDGWDIYRREEKERGITKEEADNNYIRIINLQYPELQISKRTLYRWDKDRREKGDISLVNMKGRHTNHTRTMSEEVFDIFQYYYLDESRKSISMCVELTKMETKKRQNGLIVPHVRTFIRWVDKIPKPMLMYYRYGEKALKDECLPYIHRSYEDLNSNDIWVCDNHTFDIIITKEEKPLRVYLTGFLDVRSRKMVGHYVTLSPSSDATLYALRRGIERYGIPKRILADNGREFLTFDIGGRGFRKKAKSGTIDPHTILERLGIEFKTAMVKNARAKIIERTFLTVKEEFSKLFDAYTGGNVVERPERLKYISKNIDNLTVFEDFESFVEQYIEGYYNHRSHNGLGMNGMTPNEVFRKCLLEVRKASNEELNIMLMRSTRLQKVTRAGVKLNFFDKDIYFVDEELIINHQDEKVFVRYNPSDLESVRIYDENDRYILTAKQDKAISYFASKEEVAIKMKEQRGYEKIVKAYMKDKKIKASSALDLVMEKAANNLEIDEDINPNIIKLLRSPDYEFNNLIINKAVGSEIIELDWARANNRIKESITQ